MDLVLPLVRRYLAEERILSPEPTVPLIITRPNKTELSGLPNWTVYFL
jgi:hypothetical protein